MTMVETEYGPVRGICKSSFAGRGYVGYQGIPYMKPPFGKLRFREAQAPEKWTEPFDATKPSPAYVNINYLTNELEGQEDAGVINVYIPDVEQSRPLPVMVWIHGGGFTSGSSRTDLFGPDYFMQKDVVFVTFNYRLGVIGFLSLKDPALGIPGNQGLKDQVFALKWVKKNIASFGGDPDNITLLGQSVSLLAFILYFFVLKQTLLQAGGASTHLHMLSDQSKNLFHRAILMSGVAFNKVWAFSPQRNWPQRLAEKLGFSGSGEKEILEFLESADAVALMEAENNLLTREEINGMHLMFPFGAVVEPYVNEKTFIPADPVAMARNAWSKDIDCIVGYTSSDGLGAPVDFLKDLANTLEENFAYFAPFEMKLDNKSDAAKEIGKTFKEFYFGKLELSRMCFEPYVHVSCAKIDINNLSTSAKIYLQYHSDLLTIHGVVRVLKSRVTKGQGKTYGYRFDANTELNVCKNKFLKRGKLQFFLSLKLGCSRL